MTELERTYRVVREWSPELAGYTYAVYITTHWKDDEDSVTRYKRRTRNMSDHDWAEKNANHYGVEIEDE